MQKYLVLTLGLFFGSTWAQPPLPSLEAQLSQNLITFGQTVTLQIIALHGASLDDLDFSLLEQDFVLGDISRQQRLEMINGKVRNESRLSLPLRPKRTGSLNIPAFSNGNISTNPLALIVDPQTAAQKTNQQDAEYWLEMSTPENKNYYVQQHIPITIRLFTRIPLQNVEITPPLANTIVVHKISNNNLYNQYVDQKNYQVLEQKFILIPERSGELTLSPANVSAVDLRPTNANLGTQDLFFNDPFFNAMRASMLGFHQGTPISAISNNLKINILPIPTNQNAATWLPAEKVSLRWQNTPPATLQVGQPVTLTLEIRAEEVSSAQIPPINLPEVSGLILYPGKITQKDQTDGQKIIGVRKQSFTLIGNHPGQFILPALGLDYWQLSTQKGMRAELPISGIQILATEQPVQLPPHIIATTPHYFWWGMFAGLLLMGSLTWLLTQNHIFQNFVKRFIQIRPVNIVNQHTAWVTKKIVSQNPDRPLEKSPTTKETKVSALDFKACLTACQQNDAKGAAKALLQATGFASLLHLAEVSACPPILELHAALYQQKPWQGSELSACLQKGWVWKNHAAVKSDLPSFYPE